MVACDFKAKGYRLPTEAQWKYAARSGCKSVTYAWGEGAPYRDGKPAGNARDEAAHREWEMNNYWEARKSALLMAWGGRSAAPY